ncbi:uncharacterized protein TrAFT101_005468 [Trichoderma asperellum]|uniref:Uncharacterized protein n=1 Tax=Trichoderma asperellum (strain ATCC 204424 / CBS 433.97 / NBRC 101777) TaxID=1042311 RepID=A0A2T3YYL6_TRIA4|nr:hypothetical protein M441DRAFT_255169 [Trichoderma asperellum CBS 433.97]PTB37655.1 hypothetical protein M441DRAFT_255169 [Trichoderma asperellum CBS 433.97]UKZ90451.1 hypothetical protein TrAFT101_005468 [Trichoderma asperellum]
MEEQNSTAVEATQSHAVSQQSSYFSESNEPAADLVGQELVDEDYLEGRLEIDEKRKRFDETSCTVEEKELSDLFKKGLLDDGSTGPLKGDFTLHDLPQLTGDEACSVQWTTSKRKPKEKASRSAQKNTQQTRGLTDDELASVLQACPDLESFITKST